MIHIPDTLRLVGNVLAGMGDKFAHSDAVTLVLRTGVVESDYFYQRQLGEGPARSFWQIEPPTAKDILGRYLQREDKGNLKMRVQHLLGFRVQWLLEEENRLDMHLQGNEILGVILCRLKYWPVPEPIPHARYVDLQAQYWLEHYNAGGRGSIEHFINAAKKVA
ncbi:hypothetical protein LCGC14_2945100 [marine sediment metagenome]|uniref:Uncharacterized protein n=1 Tax=marine sediment metagenome TaxID=412755 RepID=A0A0F9A816_9ZZZZ